MMRAKFDTTYDDKRLPASATCRACSEPLPPIPEDLQDSADRHRWLRDRYVEHLNQKHSVNGKVFTQKDAYDYIDDLGPLFEAVEKRAASKKK